MSYSDEKTIKSTTKWEPRPVVHSESMGSFVPPHSSEAEMNVLGSMLIDRVAVTKAIEVLESDSFYHQRNKMIYDAILGLFERGISVDILTVSEELRRRGCLESVGGSYYLVEINNLTPTAANIEHHARIVQERYLKRLLITASGKIIQRSYDDTTDALEEIDMAESNIFEIAEKRLRRSYVGMDVLAKETFAMITSMMGGNSVSGITGVPSGFHELDDMLGGFQKSDLIIVAARPSMGKTALALSIARNIAVDHNMAVGIFSIEMSGTQLLMRLLSAEARINAQDIRTNRLGQAALPLIINSISRLAEAPIYIDDSAALTIMEIRAKCRRMKAEHDVKIIMIDYLQLIHGKAESREREISIISRSLKQIAKELNIPVIALAQLNRSVEARADKTPMLSDLRESGSIEQDADVVMFVNRREQYGIMQYDDGSSTEGTAEIIIGKQRNGPVGQLRLAYLKSFTRFENFSTRFQDF